MPKTLHISSGKTSKDVQVDRDTDGLPVFHSKNFLDRIVLEYKILKASTRHFVFAVSFVVALCCIGFTTDNAAHLGTRSILEDVLKFNSFQNISSLEDHLSWVNANLLSLPPTTNSTARVVFVGPSVTLLRKFVLRECLDPLRKQFNNSTLCLSETDKRLTECILCPFFCRSEVEEPYLIQCISSLPLNSTAGYSSTDLLLINSPLLMYNPMMSNIRSRHIVYIPVYDMIGYIDIIYKGGWGIYLYREKDLEKYFFIVGFFFASFSILIDGKNVYKKFKRNQLSFINLLKHLNSFSVLILLILRWIQLDFKILNNSLPLLLVDIFDFESITGIVSVFDSILFSVNLNMLLNIISFFLICLSSIRFFRILSFHPKSKVLSSIGRIGKRDWIVLSLACFVATIYYSTVAWILGNDTWTAGLYSVMQVPFGVWPFTDSNTVVLFFYGLIVFYYFLSLLQIIVAKHYSRYRQKHIPAAALGVVEDIIEFFLVSLKRRRDLRVWPSRLALICALENINTETVCFNQLFAELSRLQKGSGSKYREKLSFQFPLVETDRGAVQNMWLHYASRFDFLKPPSRPIPTHEDRIKRIDEILNTIYFFSLFIHILSDMPGAIHPNSSNFSRTTRFNVVDRVRRLVAQGAYESRPDWLESAERAPPMELDNLNLREIRIRNPYIGMVRHVLKKFPDMRFQDCFVDGNDWSKGNDKFRADHPVMQFVARQLQLINKEGMSRSAAFTKTSQEYLERRKQLEAQHKLDMALACNQRIVPAFSGIYTTGSGIARAQECEIEVIHLNHIRRKLRMLRKEIEPHEKRRMNAKEMALDLEVERSLLLPNMMRVEVPKAERIIKSESLEKELELEESEESEFESFNLFEKPKYFENTKSKPRELSFTNILVEQPIGLLSPEKVVPTVQPTVVAVPGPLSTFWTPETSSTTIPRVVRGRPDKLTIESILAKKKFELEKRIGKEPGNEDNLDFEDFMTIIKNRKSYSQY